MNDIIGYVTEEAGRSSVDINKELAALSREEVLRIISSMEDEMAAAATSMDFEEAAHLRDQVVKLRAQIEGAEEADILAGMRKQARKGSAYGNRKHAAYGGARRS